MLAFARFLNDNMIFFSSKENQRFVRVAANDRKVLSVQIVVAEIPYLYARVCFIKFQKFITKAFLCL